MNNKLKTIMLIIAITGFVVLVVGYVYQIRLNYRKQAYYEKLHPVKTDVTDYLR